MIPNQTQVFGQLRIVIAALVGWAAGRHLIGDDTASLIVTVAPIAWPMVWSWLSSTHYRMIATVAGLRSEGVRGIIISPDATDGVAAAAADPTLPTVAPSNTTNAARIAGSARAA